MMIPDNTSPTAEESNVADAELAQRQAFGEVLRELLQRYQQADASATDEFVARLNPILARYFYALTGNRRLVEDLLQDCWLRIHKARHSYRQGDPVLPWVMAIARYTRIDQYRRWKRSSGREASIDAMVHPPAEDPRGAMESRLGANAVLAVLDSIPEGQKEVLLMLKVNGMSIEEVARATGSTATAVKQKAFRAYQSVRKALGQKPQKGVDQDDLR